MNEKKVIYPDAIIKSSPKLILKGDAIHYSSDFGVVVDESGNVKEWLSTDGKSKLVSASNAEK